MASLQTCEKKEISRGQKLNREYCKIVWSRNWGYENLCWILNLLPIEISQILQLTRKKTLPKDVRRSRKLSTWEIEIYNKTPYVHPV